MLFQIVAMTLEEAVGFWREYVRQLRALLSRLSDHLARPSAQASARERLSVLASESCTFLMRIALANPTTCKVCTCY